MFRIIAIYFIPLDTNVNLLYSAEMIYMQYKVLRKIDIVEMFTEHVLRAEKPMQAER